MDSMRLFAGIVFAISVFYLVDAWMREHQPPAPRPPATQPNTVSPGTSPTGTKPVTPSPPSADIPAERARGQRILVTTDTLKVEIDTLGGVVQRVELLKYRDTLDPTKNFVLLQDDSEHKYLAQSDLGGVPFAGRTITYSAAQTGYELASDEKALSVRLEADVDGVRVAKTYTFLRDSYLIDITFEIANATKQPIQPVAEYRLIRDDRPAAGDSKMVPTFLGAEVYTEKDKLHKASFEDIAKDKVDYPKTGSDGWVAVVQHYFLGAWLPPPGTPRDIFLQKQNNGLYAAGVKLPMGQIAAGQTAKLETRLYVGPQEQNELRKLAPGLELTVDYGYLRVIAVPLFWVLSAIHSFVHNWGTAIILLTVIIKLLFYPLSAASYKSMARMKVLAPKLQKLKERYGDDRQRMHQAMMELYKTEKVNPLGGCLPIVVQIPVFIALYWVLLLSVELRQAPFIFWIHDLSLKDPIYVLPVLMGATMFIQTWLNPAPPDPVQAKLMKIMPIAFSVFFFFFPSGLVLYWLVNNILSIAQQWYITRTLEHGKAARGEA
jgi:YidC/Oxa1 family membrane protein insertase